MLSLSWLQGLRGAFYKFDDDHNGLVTKKNFRRMLNAFMIIMTDSEFEKLCSKLGVNKSSRIGYLDFLNAFEVKDTEEGHKWLNSCHKWVEFIVFMILLWCHCLVVQSIALHMHVSSIWRSHFRYNETVPTRLMDAEYVHQILCTKAHRQYSDLAKVCDVVPSDLPPLYQALYDWWTILNLHIFRPSEPLMPLVWEPLHVMNWEKFCTNLCFLWVRRSLTNYGPSELKILISW